MFLKQRFSSVNRSSVPSKAARQTRARLKPGRLLVEHLEDRCLPATSLTGLAYGQLPLSFEANQGQTDAQVNFLARGNGYALFLTPSQAVLSLQKPSPSGANASGASPDVLRMQLVGADAASHVVGLDRLSSITNYLIGNDPSHWRTNIPNYGRVDYQQVYPGVDLTYYGNQRQLEYDFVVAPGANPGVIQLAFQGAQSMTLDSQGNLVLHTAGGDVVEHAPVVYQEVGGARQAVAGHYVLEGNGHVGFAVGAYDASQALVIDPVLGYSTYLGGSGNYDVGQGIAVDSAGNAYVTGVTNSSDFPTAYPFQTFARGYHAFVAKLNASGTALVYSTYLGGNGSDGGMGIAVDSSGDAYVTGSTSSTDFPTTAGAFQTTRRGTESVFVAQLDASGAGLGYSTYLGGSSVDAGNAIAVSSLGNAYVTGLTYSSDFPVTAGALQTTYGGGAYGGNAPAGDAFVAELNANATSLVYSTFLGGSNYDQGNGIAVDGAGNAYVTGVTESGNFPVSPGYLPSGATYNAGYVFVSKLNASGGTALGYSIFLGGSNPQIYGASSAGHAIAVDSYGNAFVTGSTSVTNFPITANALQPNYGGGIDAFVAELNATGNDEYSTYLGGSGNDQGNGIAVDGDGNAYVTGSTSSTNFPTANALQASFGGNGNASLGDAFVAKVNVGGTALAYSTYLGGSGDDQGNGIAVDSFGSAYVTGFTNSTNFPTANPLQASNAGGDDLFIAKITGPQLSISAPTSTSAGNAVNVTVTALDSNNNTVTNYSGIVHFTSTDPQAVLPGDYAFTAADAGAHTFTITLKTAGSQLITASDTTGTVRLTSGVTTPGSCSSGCTSRSVAAASAKRSG